MANITIYELAVLRAIDKSGYGGTLSDLVWSFATADYGVALAPSSIPRIVSSLVNKGLVVSDGWGSAVGFTEAGVKAYFAKLADAEIAPNG